LNLEIVFELLHSVDGKSAEHITLKLLKYFRPTNLRIEQEACGLRVQLKHADPISPFSVIRQIQKELEGVLYFKHTIREIDLEEHEKDVMERWFLAEAIS
jgi:hypothetical protein